MSRPVMFEAARGNVVVNLQRASLTWGPVGHSNQNHGRATGATGVEAC
jgi:hypothetical protein